MDTQKTFIRDQNSTSIVGLNIGYAVDLHLGLGYLVSSTKVYKEEYLFVEMIKDSHKIYLYEDFIFPYNESPKRERFSMPKDLEGLMLWENNILTYTFPVESK